MKEPIDGDCLILSGMEFQSVGAAKLKALRPYYDMYMKVAYDNFDNGNLYSPSKMAAE